METLVVVDQHWNQSYGQSKRRFIPSRDFKGINCRAFESSVRVLPPPPPFNCSPEPRAPHGPPKPRRQGSNPITIKPKPGTKTHLFQEEEFSHSELWAGPAYSNSPPPSSLPTPKFSLHQKKSVSLELPLPSSVIVLQPLAKSTPPSPRDTFSSATENLRRILQLDVADD